MNYRSTLHYFATALDPGCIDSLFRLLSRVLYWLSQRSKTELGCTALTMPREEMLGFFMQAIHIVLDSMALLLSLTVSH